MFGVRLHLIVLCTGTPGNAVIHKYMNAKMVPAIVLSGKTRPPGDWAKIALLSRRETQWGVNGQKRIRCGYACGSVSSIS